MNINLTPIIEALIGLFAALITYRLIPWIKAKTSNEQQMYIKTLIRTAVYAAEQIYNSGGQGKKKMEYVRNWLMGKGYDVDTAEIEAIVSEYINNSPFNPVVVLPPDIVEKPPNIINANTNNIEKVDTPAD